MIQEVDIGAPTGLIGDIESRYRSGYMISW